ncbi:TRAP transporter substrate-binding protein DctP [Photobacterium atrarenae]|uniref:TRAP transporter substrate-binding protein DctP n=1 Tax=Photobacterium atrarenae TaxID=865757 RepID=A0ABY5GNS5_9GAMM|nr:TRAP transporter substrate-binding protein DctP [Photobacterium atrarenae]UTV30735.1 TRAP transporter substrate-binding protein DctP [Photobacterium atrarenae]
MEINQLIKAVVLTSVSSCVAFNAAAERFILAQAYPTDHVFNFAAETFMGELEATGSEYIPQYHSGGDLGDWQSQFEQAVDGVIPVTISFGASEFDKRLDLTWLGYVADDWDSAKEIYGQEGGMLDIYNDIFEDIGLHALGIVPTGFGSMAIRKGVGKVPVAFPEDTKGLKIRTVDVPIAVERFSDWGFSAVPMPYGELYTSLQLGVIDGRGFGPSIEIWQMRDVLETYILTKDYFEQGYFLVNKEWWEDLPAEERVKMQEAAKNTMRIVWEKAENIDADYLEKVKDAGINVVSLSDDQMDKAKASIYANEWPNMEKTVGKDIMDQVYTVSGVKKQ